MNVLRQGYVLAHLPTFSESLVRTLFMRTSEKALPILYRFFVPVKDPDNLQGHIPARAPRRGAVTRSTQLEEMENKT